MPISYLPRHIHDLVGHVCVGCGWDGTRVRPNETFRRLRTKMSVEASGAEPLRIPIWRRAAHQAVPSTPMAPISPIFELRRARRQAA